MSQENVELIRRIFDSISRGDIGAVLERTADDVEMDWSNSRGPLKGVYRGREQVREVWASFVEAFDSLRWDPEEIIELDESRLIVVNHTRLRGRGSGVEVEAVGAQLWTIRDGMAQSFKLYQSKRDALEAAGLSE
jgi:ketosteroid isomerase-like protein